MSTLSKRLRSSASTKSTPSHRKSTPPPPSPQLLPSASTSTQDVLVLADLDSVPGSDQPVSQSDPAKTKKRKAKAKTIKPEPLPEDFVPRVVNDYKIGAHVSAAGGVENAIINAAQIGANAFALFVKSQRKWSSPDLSGESTRRFKERMKTFGYGAGQVVPHGSYLINLGNPDAEKREKSYECFLDDLKRCEQLGLLLYNFHPGSTVGAATKEESITHIATCLNRAHRGTSTVITLIENMAGAGNIVGSTFEELASIIDQVDDKTRVGVCLDTCHMFAAGYDIRTKETFELTMKSFDETVGLSYLRAMHINDSKTQLGSHKDRHENIGQGHLTLTSFSHLLSFPYLKQNHIPLILETPTFECPPVWAKEISVLNQLSLALAGDEKESATGGVVTEAMLEEWAAEVKMAVKEAEEGGKGKKGGATRGKKRKAVDDEKTEDDCED